MQAAATERSEAAAKGETQVRAPAAQAPAKGKRPFLVLGVVALVTVGAIGGYMVMTAGTENTDDAQVEADVVTIGARVAGQIVKVPVIDNQMVKRGDVLAVIDDADYAAKVKQVEAELETAKAQAQAADAQAQVVEATARGGLSSAKAMVSGTSVAVSSADAQIAAARAALARAEAEERKAELDLKRNKELKAANAVPQERLDNAQAAYEAAQAALQGAKAQLSAAEESKHAAESRVAEAKGRLDQSAPIDAQIATARAQADLAHARVKSAEAALEIAKLQASYTKIVAPADGMISRLSAREGQLVSPGQAIAALVPNTTYVVANFKETQIGRMKPGQKVEIEIDALPHQKFEGKVESIAGGTGSRFSLLPPDNASGNFVKVVQRVPVRVAWTPPADAPLRAGLSADVTVEVGSK